MLDIEPALEFTRETDLLLPTVRTVQERNPGAVPADTVVVSADTHYTLSKDIFYEQFPDKLKDRAPRIWLEDGVYHIGFNGKSLIPGSTAAGVRAFDTRPGASDDFDVRLADMDAEGVDKEIAFGNVVVALLFHPDIEVRERSIRIYNEHLAELQARASGRFYGVGFINHWDKSKTESSLAELKALGLKTFMLPLNPGVDVNGRPIEYYNPEMDDFWCMVEDAGLPVTHHIGETGTSEGRNGYMMFAMQNFSPFRKIFGNYIFGGILDRNPKLRIAFVEAGLSWVATAIQDGSFIYSSYHTDNGPLNYEIQKEVGEYWRDHMFATFMYDPLGLSLIDRIGAGNAMWSSDYPHAESTLGYGWDAMRQITEAVSERDARKILGGNAMDLFKL